MSDLIKPYCLWLRAHGMSERTIVARDGILRRADHDLGYGLEQSTEAELVEWLGRPHLSTASRGTYFHCLASFYRWATRPSDPMLDCDPMADIPPPRKVNGRARPVPDEVVQDVLERAANPFGLFVRLALFSGLRSGEIAGLDRKDMTEHWIDVRAAKGGDPQVAFNHPEVWRLVRHFPAGSLVEHVGGVADASWVSIRSALYFRRQLGYALGLHRFRHTFACRLRERGHDLFLIKKAMRHASIRSTEIYVEVGEGEVATAVASLPVPTRPAA